MNFSSTNRTNNKKYDYFANEKGSSNNSKHIHAEISNLSKTIENLSNIKVYEQVNESLPYQFSEI